MTKTSFKPLDDFGGPAQQCIFPLIMEVDGAFLPIGTGFVINPNGLFISASHVLLEAKKKATRKINEYGKFYDHFELHAIYVSNELHPNSDNFIGGPISVSHIWIPDHLDIGFGWLNLPKRISDGSPVLLSSVRIHPGLPAIGSRIAAIGYYEMEGYLSTENEPLVNYATRTALASGTIQEIHPEYRDRGMLKFPCFRTNARFEPGMSGGPIFTEDGSVCGVVCAGEKLIEQPSDYNTYGSLIWPIFGCEIESANNSSTKLEPILIYDLAREGHISTDETLEQIKVVKNPDGTTTTSVRASNNS